MKKILFLCTLCFSCLLTGCLSSDEPVTLSFDANGGEGFVEPIATIAFQSTDITDKEVGLTYEGKAFIGWCDSKTDTTFIYNNQYTPTKNTTLYAQWIDHFVYSEEGNGYQLESYNGPDTTITIPKEYNGKKVVSIRSEAFQYSKVVKVTIEAELNEIAASVFDTCSNLSQVTLPSTVKTIKESAFQYCTSLTTINLDNVTTIADKAFYMTTSLISINLENVETIGISAFEKNYKLTSINLNSVTTLSARAFSGSYGLVQVTLPSAITVIENSVFSGCSNLSIINLENIVEIKESGFEGCSKLTTANIQNVTTLNKNSFKSCMNLSTINLINVKTIDEGAFEGCISLTNVSLYSTINTISSTAFKYCTLITFNVDFDQSSTPSGWQTGWNNNSTVIYNS